MEISNISSNWKQKLKLESPKVLIIVLDFKSKVGTVLSYPERTILKNYQWVFLKVLSGISRCKNIGEIYGEYHSFTEIAKLVKCTSAQKYATKKF